MHLTVPAGHVVIFTEACLHLGGPNDSTKHLFRLFAYMVSCADHFPTNQVFKYSWKGADDNMNATIEYIKEKGGDECGDYGSDEDVDGDADDGGGKPKKKVVCNGKQTILFMLFLLMSHYLQVPVDEADVNHGYELVDEKDVKKMCFICTIFLPMQAFSKRQWQWHNKKGSNSSRKCISCIKKFLSKSGSIGHVLVRDHALINGLVDGKLHHVSGKIFKDRAMQCQLIDREVANNLSHDFLSKFRESSMSG